MKTTSAILLALLLAGCATSHYKFLTVAQAQAMSVELANVKTELLYHSHPFQDGQPPRLMGNRWVWTDRRGVGLEDIHARVELAGDGSTNSVTIEVFDSKNDSRGF